MDFAKHENENATMERICSQWSFTLSPFQKIAIKAILSFNLAKRIYITVQFELRSLSCTGVNE